MTVSVCPAIVTVPVRVAPVSAAKLKLTAPFPVPLVVFSVIQEAVVEAVHEPVVTTVSKSLPAEGPSTNDVVPSVTGTAGCVTAIVWPSSAICAVRAALPTGFAVKLKFTTPLVTEPMVNQL